VGNAGERPRPGHTDTHTGGGNQECKKNYVANVIGPGGREALPQSYVKAKMYIDATGTTINALEDKESDKILKTIFDAMVER
jgi:methionine synthase I (cobalamin-dependent)